MTKDQQQALFIQRRIEGVPFTQIAAELGVARSTLFKWQKSPSVACQIEEGRAVALQSTLHELGALWEQQIRSLAQTLNRLTLELEQRNLSEVPTDKLVKILFETRERLNQSIRMAEIRPSSIMSVFEDDGQQFHPQD